MVKTILINELSNFLYDTIVKGNYINIKDNNSIKRNINEYIEQVIQYKFEYLSNDEEFDFEGLLKYLKTNLIYDVQMYLFQPNIEKRKIAFNTILAYMKNYGNFKDMSLCVKFTSDILDITRTYYIDNCEKSTKVLLNYLSEEILNNIKNNNINNDNKNDIISHYLTKPPALITEKNLLYRKNEIEYLSEIIVSSKEPLVINGIGGIGKTVIGKCLYHKLSDRFDYIGWIDYDKSLYDSILNTFTIFPINTTPVNEQEKEARFQKILDFLGNRSKKLLFIDNMNQESSQDSLINDITGTNVKIVFISRLSELSDFFDIYTVDCLNESECINLFYHYCKPLYNNQESTKETVRKLVKMVQFHTLAIELLAKAYNKRGIENYYQKLIRNGMAFPNLNIKTSHTDITQSIAKHLKILFDINGFTDEKKRILYNFAFLPSINIVAQICDWINCKQLDVEYLVNIGWLTASNEEYYMHPIIKETILLDRSQFPQNVGQEFIEYFINGKIILDNENYNDALYKLNITDSVLNNIEKLDLINFAWNYISLYYDIYGDYKKALFYCEKNILLCDKGKINNLNISSVYENYSLILQHIGNFDKAFEYGYKALEINLKIFGTHPKTSISYNNLAILYRKTGNIENAILFYQNAMKINESVYGKNHLETATSYSNISVAYCDKKDYNTALEYCNKAINVRENILGSEHYLTAFSYNNIAIAYYGKKCLKNAIKYFKKALDVYEIKLGKKHPDTLKLYHSLGNVYYNMEDFQSALAYYNKTESSIENRTDNLEIISLYQNIANIYYFIKQYDKALEYYKKSLFVSEKLLGELHFDTILNYNNIGTVYAQIGDFDTALKFILLSAKYCSIGLGVNHPNFLQIVESLYNCFCNSSYGGQDFSEWLKKELYN